MSDLALPGPICDDKCREPQHIWGRWGAAKPAKISLSLNHSSFLSKSIIVDVSSQSYRSSDQAVLESTIQICCMALSMKFSINSYNSNRHTILMASFVLIENGAGDRIRTGNPLLGRQMPQPLGHTRRKGGLTRGVSPPEKIGTLKKGEKIFSLFPVSILYKNFLKKSTYFLRNQRQYS